MTTRNADLERLLREKLADIARLSRLLDEADEERKGEELVWQQKLERAWMSLYDAQADADIERSERVDVEHSLKCAFAFLSQR